MTKRMNKIEKLIDELCPDGVEFQELGQVLDYEQPTQYIVNSTKYSDEHVTPVLTAGQSFILGYTDEMEGIYKADKEKPVIIFDDFTTSFHWVDFDFKVKSSAMKMIRPKENVDISFRFIYFSMRCIGYQPQDHARHWISKYSKFKIPIPPLIVQKEIVKILDNFTMLEAELEAELEARRKQYEYYRDELLKSETSKVVKLGKIMTIVRGSSPRPISKYITNTKEGVSWIKIGDVNPGDKFVLKTKQKITQAGAQKSRLLKKGDFILSNSMSFGRPYILNIEGCIHDGWIAMSDFEDNVISDFLYHLLRSSLIQGYWRQKASSGTVQNLNADIVRETEVSIPAIEEQKRIVSILDKFDALVNDISIGLPAELRARRKQYEYYLGKLLTFLEKK
ncbi:MAG: restriction endonuclease subunit S [Candidatus Omnitrophica bacterium]|nr:restriction endonuclease subunit S [Candidatus Omnitrophota bacterium]